MDRRLALQGRKPETKSGHIGRIAWTVRHQFFLLRSLGQV